MLSPTIRNEAKGLILTISSHRTQTLTQDGSDLNIRGKPVKLLGENVCDLGLGQGFLEYKSTNHK